VCPDDTALQLFQGVRAMRDSDTFMAILDEGKDIGLKEGMEKGHIEEVRKLILRLGQKNLGLATKDVKDQIEAINDLARLEVMCERTQDVKSWTDLLNDNA
jgi:hypothetical protein